MKIIQINQVVNIAYCFKRYLIGLLFLIGPLHVSAQNISLFEQFNGQYDFTAIGNTLNTGANACNILTQSEANLTLTANQDLVAARLYWSGSGGDLLFPADNNVTLNGTDVSAERTFTENSVGLTFFGAYADVTDIVAANGNGTYTLSNLDLTNNIYNPPGPGNSSQYCNQTVDYGGWSIIIIYEEDGLALNQISLFDGLEVVYQNELIITLGPLNVASDQLAKIGFLAWEGDLPNPNNESLRINNILVDDPPLNPGNNQFNGTNTYTNSTNLFNMDLDVYDLEGLYDIEEGDEEIEIKMTSDSDLILINNIITSVNSELPDASIIFEPIEFICNDTVDINWTVFNVNSTGALPAGTPIKFYLEGAQIGQDNTTTTIPIDGAEPGTVTLTIPTGTVADPFTIIAVVDDGGGGVSTVDETNEGNNEYDQEINLADVTLSVVLDPDILIANDDAICDGEPKVIGIIPGGLTPPGAAATYQWFFNDAIIPGETNEDLTVTQAGTYTLEVTYQGCDTTDEIIVEFVANPIAGIPTPLVECDEVPNNGEAEFTLTDADTDVINGQANTFVTYHETEAQAEAGTNVLPGTYVSSTQTIYARLEENTLGCYDVIALDLIVNAAPAIAEPIAPYLLCDNDQDGEEPFDLTSKNTEIENGLPDITLTYYNTEADANAEINAIATPTAYTSAGNETIWVRAVNLDGCVTVSSFQLELIGVAFNPITRFSVCDDDTRDGLTEFDLESLTPTITASDPNISVTYHLTEADAEAGTIPSLSSPFDNSTNPQLIWVRVEDDITECYGVFNLLLGVISPIAGTPTPLVECDEVPNDGLADFDLLDPILLGQIIGVQTGMAVTFHPDQTAADAGTPILPNTYNGTTQTIVARLQSSQPGFEDCYDTIALDLIVNAAPAIADPIDSYPLCDNNQDGEEPFDLTSKNTEIENGLPNITLTYYNSEQDAIDDINPIPTSPTAPSTTNYPSTGGETIWVRAVNLDGCVTVSSFELVIEGVYTGDYVEVPLFQVCDDDPLDGITAFDLDSQTPIIQDGDTNLDITYHESQGAADDESSSIDISIPFNSPNQTIYVRVENATTFCYDTFEMELEVISVIGVIPADIIECDEVPNDGKAIFDLTVRETDILNGQTAVLSYYELEADAEIGNPVTSITDPVNFENTTIDTQTVYVRLEEPILGCFDVVPLNLIVNAAPAIADPIDSYPLCDNNQDGEEPFDLTSKNTEIENGLPNITLTYYNSEQDAIDDINPIPTSPTAPSTTNYPSTGGETIWVRAVNLDGCVTVSSFELVIEGVYTGDYVEVPLFQVCDDDPLDGITAFDLDSQTPIIQDGDTNLDITYHESQGAADDESSSIDISIPFNSPNQTIYVRVENATTFCYDTFEMELEVISVIGVIPADIIECDEVPNDGKAIFDLTVRETDILNGQTAVLSYYELEADAEIGNPVTSITDPVNFENTTIDTQTVYVRLEEPILGCFDVVPLNLIVNAAPAIADPIDSYPLCDNNQDGEEPFDLTSKNTEIENGLPNITLTYYNSEQDAIDDINPIPTSPTAPSTTNYPSTGGETIWVRAVNLDGCVTVSSFELVIEGVYTGDYVEVPLFQVCDDDPLDGITAFDLDSQTPIIQDGDTNLDITYHESQGAADDESSSIDISIPFNSPNQTIYVRVENATTFCYDTFEMELEVISVIGVIPADIIECDEVPNDGKAIFDLTVRETDILNGQTAVLSYYELEADAEIGNPVTSITDPVNFENTTIDTQTVYVRLEEPILGCFDVVPLNLIVNAAPAIADPIDSYPLCDNDQNTTEDFNLITWGVDEILNGLTDVTLTYFNTQADADLGDPATEIPTPNAYTSAGAETIWVRAVNLENCVTVSSFELVIDTVPIYTEVPLFQVCDDSNPDGQTDFDLDSQNIDIATVGGVFNPDLTVTYHLTEADAEAGTIPSLSSPFNNTTPFSQTIWVRVEDDITGCYGDFQMELFVNPLPTPVVPADFIECDEDNDGFFDFDLTLKDAEIIGGQPGVVITYHETPAAAEAGTPVLLSPYTNTSGPIQTIYARATITATGCFDIVPMDLVVNPTPIIPTSITPIEICDINLDNVEDFDLTERASEIYGPQSTSEYTLTYYESAGAADSGTGEIMDPSAYQNTSDPQTIWVRLENNVTTCYSVGSFNIGFIFCALPDATIVIDNIGVLCSDSNLDITYTVFNNTVTGGILPANTPIAFYADGVLIGTENTTNPIAVNGNEVATTSLFIPVGTPFIFTLTGVVDDDGTGLGIVGEENETNNEFDILVNLEGETINLGPDIESCIGYTVTLDADLGEPGFNYQWFLDGNLIPGATNPLLDVTGNGFYRIEAVNGACFVFGELNVNFNAPPVATPPTPLFSCDEEPNDGIADFTLTDKDNEIIGGVPNTFVTYYETQALADIGDPANALVSPFTNTIANTQIIFARLEDIPVGCFDVVELELIVNGAPTITNPISEYFICDNDNDSTETFDLTTKYDEIVNILTGITLTYYNTEADAEDGDPATEIPTPTAYISAGGETIWVRATDLAGCVTIGSFDLVAGMIPTFVEVDLLQFCDDATLDGFITFDLDAQTPIIDNGDPNLIVTYHPTQAEAEASTNPILVNPYTNIINPEFIGVRVEDGTTGCFATFEMELNVISIIAGTPGTPTELIECDEEPNDGFAEFTLTDADAIITNGQTGTVTYHFTEDQAENGTNELPIVFTNTTPDTQIIFARLEEGILGCYDVIALELIVKQAPTITNPISDYRLCDNDEDGTEDFDLTSKYDEIVNTLTGITLTYYNTEPDADLGDPINEITTPAAYPSTGLESIWVRAVNLDGCVTVGVFDLVIDTVPIFTEVPLLESCDFGITDGFTEFDLDSQIPTIVAGDLDLNVTYHISQTDAEDDFDPISSPYTNVSNPETIFVRVESAITGCYGTFEMVLEVNSPSITTPDDLEYCDPDSDGFGVFTLTDADSQVTGGIPTGNLQVTYHYLIEDAQNGINALTSPYANDVPFLQTVHVRLYDQTTQCYSITTLDLIVLTTPPIEQPNDLEVCDDDADGIAIFDLTVSEPEILNLIDPADWPNFTIAYFEDPALTIEIGNPAVYFSIPPSPQTIYIVVEDLINGCLSQTTTLQLWVYPPPELIAPLPYALCDVTEITGPNDELEPFDLESKTDELTGGDPNISITYYETQADADAGTNPLSSPYINIENPQTIFVRAEESNNLCTFSTGTTLDLVVNPLPSPETPTPLEVCDDNNDGLAEFILTDKDDEIIAGEPGVAITYHELEVDAETGANPLTSPYTNTTTYSQIVYARVEFPIALGGTGCFTIVELELIATPTPVIPVAIPDLVACDDDGDGLTEFDLTLQQDIIFGDQNPIDYTLTYHTTEPDAQDGTNPIATPEAFLNTTNPQTIWVRLQDNANTCIKIGSFELVVELAPVFTLVPVVELCDDLVQDGFTEFDLNLQNNTITGGDPTLSVTYYPTELDAEDATNPLSLPHTNVVNPETIFVRVQSGVTGCYATFPMELIVVEAPTIVTPNPLEVCDPDNDGFSEFILTDADLEVTGGIPTGNLVVTYHYLLEDAINNVLPLASPYENEVPFLQTIFVRLVDQTTGCFNTTTLDLIVKDSPQIVAPDPIVACDDDSDGIEVFDLTVSEPQILENAGTGAYTVNYYEDAALTLEIVNPTAYSNISNPQTIFIVVEDQDPNNICTSETTLLLEVVDVPTLVPPTELEVCDAITLLDGFEPFDLESKTDEITGGNPIIEVTYYETQADADAGTNALVSPYTNIENPQTIFIRAEDLNTGCVVSQGITLSLVVNPLPSPEELPDPLESCDDNNDGLAEFILTDKDDEIIAGEPGVAITYHELVTDAETGVNPLTSPYTNTTTYSQIVYARVEFPIALGGTGCFTIVELELIATPTPVIPVAIPDLVACDDDGDGLTEFDLTLQQDIIFGDQNPIDYTLTYHTTEPDAQDGTNPIATPEAFLNTTNPQTIWVRLQDNANTCIKIGSFELVVELAPVFTLVPVVELCDDLVQDGFTEFDLNLQNNTITGGDPTLSVTYYPTELDAEDATNPLSLPHTNVVNPETIFVRVQSGVTGCYATFPMELIVVEAPTIVTPNPLEVCDPDNDGFSEFILTDADLEVTGGIPTGNLVVTYHYLLEDAINNVLPLASPYENEVPFLQTIFVRLVDQTTGCFNTTTLDLIVKDSPQIVAPDPIVACDDDSDGIEVFDLTQSEPQILENVGAGTYVVTYYEDAALTLEIVNPTAYSNISNPQTIFIVVEDQEPTNLCTSETTLLLEVVDAPTLVPPTELEMCDMTEIVGPGDELEPFDLESKTDEITGGDLTIEVTYYETQADADAGTNALVSPYTNIENPQTIFIRAEDLNTGCVVSQGITLSLVVNPLPSPVTPTPLESCDVSNDGFTFFTLTDKDDEIIAGEPGVTVSYYETLFDAEQAVDPLISPYTNIVTPSQIVYARAEFPVALGGTGCFKIVELELIVIPTPVIPIEMEDLVVCDDDGDGFAEFDLTLQETIIFGDDQDPDDYTLTYYLLETDAQDDINPIANPESFENTTNPQTIWVRLQDNVTECPKIGSFDIRVEIGPEIFEPTPLTQCDDLGEPNDEVTLFDLTAKNDEITGGASGLTVQYYETQADAEADVNEIDPDTAYQNTSNPQIVWVRVTDVNTLCVDTTVSLTIRVAANPEPEQPDPIVLCDVTNPGDQQEVFDLTIRQAQILDGETWTLSYHNSFEDAVDNSAPIATPTAYTNISTPEIVYVRVSIDPTDPQACFEIVELELIVNPIPDGSAVVTPYIICEIPSDNEAIFDLTTKNGEILNGQDPVLFEVLFYESQADADAMLNPIQEPETYTNQTNPQTIFVVILNTDTACFVATQSFDIEEREGAVANTPLEPYAICDYYNANDGIAEFDLLNQELLDEILGGQDPSVYQLDFYGTLENAELEIAPLPIIYENVINPQIIYARVTNINSECYDIAEVILKVELIPEVVLEPSYRLCVDAAGVPIQEEEGSASPPVIDTQLDPSVYMFEWQLDGDVLLGEIGASITALQEGNYSVTVTEILTGCMAATDTQVVISSPPLNYDVQVTEAFASQHNITATADGIGEYIFQLDDNPFQDNGYFLNVVPGTHTITIKDIYGCGSITTEVAVIDFPRFITPNQDGYHDTWNILGISIGDPTAKIYIFDRFGKLLKQISPMSPGWDGTYNGNPLPSNDYWFRVEYTENNIKKEFSGHFSLKR